MVGTPGRSGRKPKPVERKIAAGNPGKRALNRAAPNFGAVVNVEPTKPLRGTALEVWLEIVPLLCAQKVLQATDLGTLTDYCIARGVYLDAYQDTVERGLLITNRRGDQVSNPSLTTMAKAVRAMATFGGGFALDPASRQRLVGPQKRDAGDELKTILEM